MAGATLVLGCCMDLRLVSLPVYITSGVTCLNDLLVYLDNAPFSKAKEDPNFKLSLRVRSPSNFCTVLNT